MKINKSDNKYIYVIAGKNIKRIREEKGLTQVQLADLIKYNEGTISNIENDSFQTFSLEFLYIISKKLKVPMSEFFKEIDQNNFTLIYIEIINIKIKDPI